MPTTTLSRSSPPFNFQGSMTEGQKDAFKTWVEERSPTLAPISDFHRIRALQLRKAAGLLEAAYADQGLAPTFKKAPWAPSENGHFLPSSRDDRAPALAVGAIKDRLQAQLAYHDRAVFRMNFLRTQVEVHEDLAQEAAEAPTFFSDRFNDLEACFNNPHYAEVLVKDGDTFSDGVSDPDPVLARRHRVHPLDPPTYWERFTAGQPIS